MLEPCNVKSRTPLVFSTPGDELAALSKQMGKALSAEELDAAIKEMDEDGNGTIELDELTAWWRAQAEKGGSSTSFAYSLFVHLSTRAGIEWCCCHRAVCMARPR